MGSRVTRLTPLHIVSLCTDVQDILLHLTHTAANSFTALQRSGVWALTVCYCEEKHSFSRAPEQRRECAGMNAVMMTLQQQLAVSEAAASPASLMRFKCRCKSAALFLVSLLFSVPALK